MTRLLDAYPPRWLVVWALAFYLGLAACLWLEWL